MLKARLSILWFSKKIIIIPFMLLLASCSTNYLYNSKILEYTNLVYVQPIPERAGMIITSYLSTYFKNQNIDTSKYLLQVDLSFTETLQLNNIYGFSTQGELWVIANWKLLYKNTKKPYISSSVYHPAYYNIDPSIYSTNNNKDVALNLVLKNLATEISLKVTALLKQTYKTTNNEIIKNNNQ